MVGGIMKKWIMGAMCWWVAAAAVAADPVGSVAERRGTVTGQRPAEERPGTCGGWCDLF